MCYFSVGKEEGQVLKMSYGRTMCSGPADDYRDGVRCEPSIFKEFCKFRDDSNKPIGVCKPFKLDRPLYIYLGLVSSQIITMTR